MESVLETISYQKHGRGGVEKKLYKGSAPVRDFQLAENEQAAHNLGSGKHSDFSL